MFGTLNFTEYCEFSVRSDEKYHAVLEEAQRIHFGTLNFTEYCEFSVRSDEKYHAVLEEAQRIHSVWHGIFQ